MKQETLGRQENQLSLYNASADVAAVAGASAAAASPTIPLLLADATLLSIRVFSRDRPCGALHVNCRRVDTLRSEPTRSSTLSRIPSGVVCDRRRRWSGSANGHVVVM